MKDILRSFFCVALFLFLVLQLFAGGAGLISTSDFDRGSYYNERNYKECIEWPRTRGALLVPMFKLGCELGLFLREPLQ